MMKLFTQEYIQNAFGREKYNEGKGEGREQISKLIALLIRDGRNDELLRASTDKEYQDLLIEEYQLA